MRELGRQAVLVGLSLSLCLGLFACQRSEQDTAGASALDIATADSGEALYDNSPRGVACQKKYHRQLDELLKLNLRHLREDRILQDVKHYMATDFLAKSQLQTARHALEKAQMDYRHAKENVAMNCRFSSEQEN